MHSIRLDLTAGITRHPLSGPKENKAR